MVVFTSALAHVCSWFPSCVNKFGCLRLQDADTERSSLSRLLYYLLHSFKSWMVCRCITQIEKCPGFQSKPLYEQLFVLYIWSQCFVEPNKYKTYKVLTVFFFVNLFLFYQIIFRVWPAVGAAQLVRTYFLLVRSFYVPRRGWSCFRSSLYRLRSRELPWSEKASHRK